MKKALFSPNFSRYYLSTLLMVIFFAIAGAFIEYNYFLIEGLPLRTTKEPSLFFLYRYDLIFFIPVMLFLAFQPLIYQLLSKTPLVVTFLKRNLALGVGNLMVGLVLKDALWFLFRKALPLTTDPLASQWICPSDYTASFIGSVEILGAVIPLWYIAFLPPIIAIFTSLVISEK